MVDFTAVSKAHWLQRFGEYQGSPNIHCIVSFKSAVPCKVKKKAPDFLIDAVLNQIIMVDQPFCRAMLLQHFFPPCKNTSAVTRILLLSEKKLW